MRTPSCWSNACMQERFIKRWHVGRRANFLLADLANGARAAGGTPALVSSLAIPATASWSPKVRENDTAGPPTSLLRTVHLLSISTTINLFTSTSSRPLDPSRPPL